MGRKAYDFLPSVSPEGYDKRQMEGFFLTKGKYLSAYIICGTYSDLTSSFKLPIVGGGVLDAPLQHNVFLRAVEDAGPYDVVR